jgi:thiamine biosynthesis lipoprotein
MPAARGTSSFEAMGCEVVVGGASPDEVAAVQALFRARDALFSRFRPERELNAVNGSASPVIALSPAFAATLAVALRAAAATGGLVDPTVGAALESAGYDRDFGLLEPDPRPAGPASVGRVRALRLAARLLARPPGLRLDLNGVVKGLAVDDALALLAGDGFVSAGGDVASRGPCTVALPGGGAVHLLSGGIATSGTTRRRWLRAGEVEHHLIDPRTGRPSTSRWRQVTVAAASCLAADVAAKAAFLLDSEGPGWLDARNLPGRFLASGTTVENDAWRAACQAGPC